MREQVGTLTPKLERLIHTLEWVRIEEFTKCAWCGVGCPPAQRAWLANAFVAKSVLGLGNTGALMSQQRVSKLYDVMDAAYCSKDLRERG